MKSIVVIFLVLGIVFFGCTQQQYVCSDGTTVTSPNLCQKTCTGNSDNYCTGTTWYHDAKCVNGIWQYSQQVCPELCSETGCVAKPKANFSIYKIEYDCLAKNNEFAERTPELVYATDNIRDMQNSSKNGIIQNIYIDGEGNRLPEGNWSLGVKVFDKDDALIFQTSGFFDYLFGTRSYSENIRGISGNGFISAPYSPNGKIEVNITSPEGVSRTYQEELPKSSECEFSKFTAYDMIQLVEESLTKNDLKIGIALGGLNQEEDSYINKTGDCDVAYYAQYHGIPGSLYSNSTCKSYSNGGCSTNNACVSILYYDDRVAAPSIKDAEHVADVMGYDAVTSEANGMVKYSTPANASHFLINCKNRAWISIMTIDADSQVILRYDNAVDEIAKACQNS